MCSFIIVNETAGDGLGFNQLTLWFYSGQRVKSVGPHVVGGGGGGGEGGGDSKAGLQLTASALMGNINK